MRRTRPTGVLAAVAAGAVLVGCGGDDPAAEAETAPSEQATSSVAETPAQPDEAVESTTTAPAEPDEPVETTAAAPAEVPVVSQLDWTAEAVGGGQVIGADYAGQDLVVWFWAPW